jgi:hypothetical protein
MSRGARKVTLEDDYSIRRESRAVTEELIFSVQAFLCEAFGP